jgi:hypothetical protein
MFKIGVVVRIKILVASMFVLLCGCQTTTEKNDNSTSIVTYGLIFAIKIDAEGKVTNVRYSSATDPRTKRWVEFTPSKQYLEGAERQLKSRTFNKADDPNKESFMPCFYVDQRPNQALCGGDL